jgi:class 3 adenylate cyclase
LDAEGVIAKLPARIVVPPVSWEEPSMSEGAFVLPSGTVTLLLGDVEASTRTWESDPGATAAAIGELNGLVNELVGRFDGVRPVEQGEGDSFVAAFSRARDGLACALKLQLMLLGSSLRVRVGLHTGDVVRRDEGNYVGPAIIRAARLRNLAHGGQTVVSDATRELVIDTLPEGCGLRDLGVHRLKDMSRPERVFQLCHSDLADQFPPLRSLDVHPHNLPVQRTTFIGRAGEIAALAGLLGEERLVTVTGSGGCGKTRLALQVAAEVLEHFPDGVWLVDLAVVSEGEAVAAKAAQAVPVMAGSAISPVDALVAQLRTPPTKHWKPPWLYRRGPSS